MAVRLERSTGCHWCPWQLSTAPDGSQFGTEAVLPLLHVAICHPDEVRAVGRDPEQIITTVRTSDVVTPLGWAIARGQS